MVVDPKTLNNGIFKYNIWSNVLNKLTWQQAQTPAQQPTNTPITQTTWTQGLQQQPEVYKVITNKFPTYDIKDMMWAGSMKNQIWFMQSVWNYNRLQAQANANTDPNVRYNLTKPELTNKQTLQIQQATPETNEQWLKINKTNSFKDLVIDLQNVANQWRNLEFVKFRDLYPEYVENWDKVVDLFESIKANPQYSAEQVTTTAQKAYPELFGIKDNLSDKDKTTALKKLYDEMVSNKQNWIQLTQQDIIDRYPEYANTEDINTVMEVQNLMNRDRKNTPTFNDIYENFESLTKWDVEVWNTEKEQIKKDLANLDKLEARQYNYLSDEWKEYVKLLWAAKAITDELKKNYWIPNDVSERDVLQEVKNKYPDIYSQLTNWVSENVQVSDKDRKLLEWGSTAKSAWKYFKWNLLEFIINTEAWLWDIISTLWNANADFYRDLATALWHWDEWNDEKFREWSTLLWDTLTRAAWWQKEDLESKQRYKEFQEENQKSFKQAMKDWDWTTMIWKSTWLIWQTLPALITSAASGWATWVWFATFLPSSYERALEDLEADESIKLTDNQKRWVALLMWSVESAIEEMSLNMMFPWLKSGWWLAGQVLNKIPWMKNALLRFAVQTELWAASESMEEVAQEFSNNLIARAAWSDRDMWEFSDYWDIFTETFLSSQLISALWWAGEWINQAKINQIQKQITEQTDLRNKVLEWQAIMANDFNEFANAVEVVPWTTTEELQQIWNNTQQKKQDLEEKANRITSNSYSNVATPTYERATIKDTVKPKITANESQQYTELLDEMVKNKEISEEDRKRVEKTLWVFTLNTEWEQYNRKWQQQQPSWLANINQSNNTNTEEKSNIISRSQNQLVQNYNRMNPKAINDFKKQFKQDYGQFLIDRWFTKAWEDNLDDLVQYADTLLNLKDKALEPMQWRYQDRSLEDMLEMVYDRAVETKDYAKIEEYEKLLQKYNEWWIEVSEILSMMRWFNNKIKTGFFKEQNSVWLEKATNVYMATRDFLDQTASENWFESLDKINREIRKVEHIIWWITYKMQWSSANNMLWLNDYIALWAVIANPEAFAFALTKLALKEKRARNLLLKVAVGKRWNAENRITQEKLDAELKNINDIADGKKRDVATKEFVEKLINFETQKALPEYKPIAEVWENWPKINKPNTPQPTIKKDIVEINNTKPQSTSETEKKSEKKTDKAEQVQGLAKTNQNSNSETKGLGQISNMKQPTLFQKWRWNPITKKQVTQLVKQLKKTWLAKDVKIYETQEDFEKAMEEEDARLQSVWHGGWDFNRFDLNHVWEWEWNAAHWYWIYVTENKDRASEYWTLYRDNAYWIDTTFGRWTEQFVTYKWKKINELDWENSYLVEQIINWMQTKNEAYPYYDAESQIARIRRSINSEQNTWLWKLSANEFAAMKKRNQEKLDFLDSLDPNDFKVENTKRNLYDVEVPDTVKKDTPTWTNYLEEDGMITHEAYTEINDKLSEKIWEKLTRWSNKVTGKVLYERLTEKLGSMKAASEFLKDLWYDGIHYIWELDWSSYVIFDDKALQINDHIKYLKDTNWDIAWATTPDGTVHLIESNLRWDTATHEFSHLLWSYAKKNNPNLYKALQKIAKEAPQELKDYVKRTYGEMTDEAFLDEVFAWKQGKYSWIKTARTWYQRMWDAIKNIWNSIKNSFGSKYTDLDVFEAYETMSSEELMDRVDKLLKWGKEIGRGKWATQFEVAGDIYSNNFKNWFWDWENWEWSKIVDENWKPLKVYHGTESYWFTIFKGRDFWDYDNDMEATDWIYFTDDKSNAKWYENVMHWDEEWTNKWTYEVYLSIKNPLVVDYNWSWWNGKKMTYTIMNWDAEIKTFLDYDEAQSFKKEYDSVNSTDTTMLEESVFNNWLKSTQYYVQLAKKQWNDWVIFKNIRDSWVDNRTAKLANTYVVFNSNQIKSATDNVGTYDPNNPDIRYEKIWWLSNMQIRKFAVQQWLAEISNQ